MVQPLTVVLKCGGNNFPCNSAGDSRLYLIFDLGDNFFSFVRLGRWCAQPLHKCCSDGVSACVLDCEVLRKNALLRYCCRRCSVAQAPAGSGWKCRLVCWNGNKISVLNFLQNIIHYNRQHAVQQLVLQRL